jgi:hypothetical protein
MITPSVLVINLPDKGNQIKTEKIEKAKNHQVEVKHNTNIVTNVIILHRIIAVAYHDW